MNKLGFTDERSKRRSFFFLRIFYSSLSQKTLVDKNRLLEEYITNTYISCNIFERVIRSQLKLVFGDKLSQFLSSGQ